MRGLVTLLPCCATVAMGRCLNSTEFNLEFVLAQSVVDLSALRHPINHFELSHALSTFSTSLKASYEDAKFTLVGFHDYGTPGTAAPHDACYRHYTNMQEPGAWAKAVDGLFDDSHATDGFHDPTHDSSLAAAMLAATRKETGFTTGSHDAKGKPMVRIVAINTDKLPVIGGGMYKDSPVFKMDGKDTCKNDAPSMAQIKSIINATDLHLVVLSPKKNETWWKTNFPQVHFIENDNLHNPNVNAIIEEIHKIVCTVVPPTPPPTTTSTPSPATHSSHSSQFFSSTTSSTSSHQQSGVTTGPKTRSHHTTSDARSLALTTVALATTLGALAF